jgi:hypothetical protein
LIPEEEEADLGREPELVDAGGRQSLLGIVQGKTY